MMLGMLGALGVVAICSFILLLFIVGIVAFFYNKFVTLRNRVENGWAQIDVQLKKRFDLIPNLVNTVKGYAKHERGVFEEVARLRSAINNAETKEEYVESNNQLTNTLKTLFAVAENYPDLKANENFMQLQGELSEIEGKIAYSRQFYNDIVYKFNTEIQKFPGVIFAKIFGFKEQVYFKASDEEKENVKVEF
jgi:LemA protein